MPVIREIGPPNTNYTNKVYFTHWGGIKACLNDIGIDCLELTSHTKNIELNNRLKSVLDFKCKYNRWPLQRELKAKNNLPSYRWVYSHFKNLPDLINHLENNFQVNNS